MAHATNSGPFCAEVAIYHSFRKNTRVRGFMLVLWQVQPIFKVENNLYNTDHGVGTKQN